VSTTNHHSSDEDRDLIGRAIELYQPLDHAGRQEVWLRVRETLRQNRARSRRRFTVVALALASSVLIFVAGLGAGYALSHGGLAAYAPASVQGGPIGSEAKIAKLEQML
jgi:hypothetical protein